MRYCYELVVEYDESVNVAFYGESITDVYLCDNSAPSAIVMFSLRSYTHRDAERMRCENSHCFTGFVGPQ